MSSNHSWKSSALTSDIPGGRVPLICEPSQNSIPLLGADQDVPYSVPWTDVSTRNSLP
jgi:hypothetical protein